MFRHLWKTLYNVWHPVPLVLPFTISMLFVIWPLFLAIFWRLGMYLLAGVPDPAFYYWGFKIQHLPYIHWGTWPSFAWFLLFSVAVSLFVYTWVKLVKSPYDWKFKLGWWYLLGVITILSFSVWG